MAAKTRSDNFYREAPFWSWNDILTEREAVRQIDLMHEGGWGGFFMHARPGLVTEYMGKQWMRVVKACVARARKLGMCAYLYDENRWPSGFAGGEIPRKSASFRSKFLLLSENLVEKGPNYKFVASYAAGGTGPGLRAAVLAPGKSGPRGAKTYHLYQYTTPLGDPWFLGSTYVDLLAPETTKEFIRVAHKRYKAAVGGDFGGAVPGIFTDEPSLPFHDQCPGPAVPWTPTLPEVFKKRRGYDLMPQVMSLFLRVGDFRKVRYDFYRTVNEMFVENFAKQIYQWCQANKIAHTGHMMAEDTLAYQMEFSCGVMPFYEYFQIPGIDHLGNNISNPATAKQTSSVADQLGRKRVLSELYGTSGQDLNLKGRKWIADWHFALGINLLNPHLWLYTMRGARKRDFPPNIGYQQAHFAKWAPLSDRNARLSQLLTRGKRVVDVLVIHPMETGWCVTSPLEPGAIESYDKSFQSIVDTLLAEHIDFHFGDESLTAKYGGVSDGKFAVGKGRYGVVIVAETLSLRRSTAQLLARLAKAGGKVIVANRKPTLVEGARGHASILRKALAGAAVVPISRLGRYIRKAARVPVEITGNNAAKVLYHLRDLGRERILFIANTDYDRGADVRVTVRTGDCFAGEMALPSRAVSAIPARCKGRTLLFDLALAPAQSVLLLLGAEEYPSVRAAVKGGKTLALGGKWRVARMDENALTLDHVRTPGKGNTWADPEYVLFAAEAFTSAGGAARARYEFEVETGPKGPVHFVMERPERWAISVNGRAVASKPRGYYLDTEFKRINITGLVLPGRNVVEIAGKVTSDFELESAYLTGDFGVRQMGNSFTVIAPPAQVRGANLGSEGLTFFAGTLDLEKEIKLQRAPKSAALVLDNLAAGAAEVLVNGRSQGNLLYPPYRVELKGLKRGRNTITLRLYSTLRNLLGPHHFEGPEINWVSPNSFVNRKLWTDDYRFLPFGIRGAAIELA